jgi:hypothetical protein
MYRPSFTHTGAPVILKHEKLDIEETSRIDYFSQANDRCQYLNSFLFNKARYAWQFREHFFTEAYYKVKRTLRGK